MFTNRHKSQTPKIRAIVRDNRKRWNERTKTTASMNTISLFGCCFFFFDEMLSNNTTLRTKDEHGIPRRKHAKPN